MNTDTEVVRDLLFWFDCETAGLYPATTTVLEVAWCITDANLRMVSPLRQRFTRIMAPATGREGKRPADQYRHLLDPTDDATWHDNDYISPVARQMHQASGLRADWVETAHTRPHAILTHPRDFHRLVAEDLDLALDSIDLRPNEVVRFTLAGAGVSHFDDAVLTEAFANFYPRRPIIDGGSSVLVRWHYRCFDTSVALAVAGPDARAAIDEISRQFARQPNPDQDVPILPFSLVRAEHRVDDAAEHLTRTDLKTPELSEFVRSTTVQHRAADDVVWSLLDARALRYLASQASR